MKVYHVFKIKAICGSEKHLLTLLPQLAARGIGIGVILLVEPGKPVPEFSHPLERHGIKVSRVKIGFDLSLPALVKVTRLLKSEKPDIVHTHLIHGDLYGTLAARRAGIRKIISSKHNDDQFRKQFVLKKLIHYLNRQAVAVIAISGALKEFCIQHENIPPEKIEVIHYGLEGFEKSLKDQNLRQRLGYTNDEILFGIIARLSEQKGHRYLLTAFKELVCQCPNGRLLIVGDGRLQGELEKLSSILGLSPYVRFLGRREDTADIYNALDVFVHPSLWEGFGLVFLEAMSFALPIIATNVSAIPELVAHGKNGMLVPAGNVPELVKAMAWMIEHPQKRREMGQAGRERLLYSFGIEKMVEKTLSIYEQV